jgi:5-methylcytosine-specific restriction endonuclease McrA
MEEITMPEGNNTFERQHVRYKRRSEVLAKAYNLSVGTEKMWQEYDEFKRQKKDKSSQTYLQWKAEKNRKKQERRQEKNKKKRFKDRGPLKQEFGDASRLRLPKDKAGWEREYLHPLWIKRRIQIKKRDNNLCTVCHQPGILQVHHLTYDSRLHVWEYEDQHLITVCDSCHEKLHQQKPIGEFYSKTPLKRYIMKLNSKDKKRVAAYEKHEKENKTNKA